MQQGQCKYIVTRRLVALTPSLLQVPARGRGCQPSRCTGSECAITMLSLQRCIPSPLTLPLLTLPGVPSLVVHMCTSCTNLPLTPSTHSATVTRYTTHIKCGRLCRRVCCTAVQNLCVSCTRLLAQPTSLTAHPCDEPWSNTPGMYQSSSMGHGQTRYLPTG